MIRHNKYIFPIEIRLKKESTCCVTDAFPFIVCASNYRRQTHQRDKIYKPHTLTVHIYACKKYVAN